MFFYGQGVHLKGSNFKTNEVIGMKFGGKAHKGSINIFIKFQDFILISSNFIQESIYFPMCTQYF